MSIGKFLSACLCLCVLGMSVGHVSADVITQWNFNGASATTIPGGINSPDPSVGSGISSLLGGVTGGFNSGIVIGGSSDPVTTSPRNFGWQTTTYAAQGTEDKQRGIQFLVSTVGFENISVGYDLRHSNTSSRWEQVQYTTDGILWNDVAQFEGPAGDTWFNNRVVDLSSISGVNNNPNFGMRVVATFGPSGSYEPSNTASTYGPAGTWRFDMVTVSGSPLTGGVTGDFNNDGLYDCLDVNALVVEIVGGSNPPSFDLTGDGFVNGADLSEWLVVGGQNNPAQTSGNPFRPGDANLDGVVDGSDYGIWNSNKFTSVAAWCSGDFNADGVVDGSDYGIWNSNKFTSSSDAQAVPEPVSLGWFALLALGAMARRCH